MIMCYFIKIQKEGLNAYCSGKLLDPSYFMYDITIDTKDKEYSIDLKVSITKSENNKKELVVAIKEIFEQIKIDNYDCREIKVNGSASINKYNNVNICILSVYEDNTEVYNAKQYNKEHFDF